MRPLLVYNGIDNGMMRPAVFGLHVEDVLADLDVRIEARTHRCLIPLARHARGTRTKQNSSNTEFI